MEKQNKTAQVSTLQQNLEWSKLWTILVVENLSGAQLDIEKINQSTPWQWRNSTRQSEILMVDQPTE